MRQQRGVTTGGFSLIELVIVVAIAAIIGAIAVPRLGSSADRADESAWQADLVVLQNAIERYAAEHLGRYPDKSEIVEQLTRYTDSDGNISATRTPTHIFGPYLRKVPPAYRAGKDNQAGEDVDNDLDGNGETEAVVELDGKDLGWRYDEVSGRVRIRNGDFSPLD